MKQRGPHPSMFSVPQEMARRGASDGIRTRCRTWTSPRNHSRRCQDTQQLTFHQLFQHENTCGRFLNDNLAVHCDPRPSGSNHGDRTFSFLQDAFELWARGAF